MKRQPTEGCEDEPSAKRIQYIKTDNELDAWWEPIEWVDLRQANFYPFRTPKFNGLRRPKQLQDIWPRSCFMEEVVFAHHDYYPYLIHPHGFLVFNDNDSNPKLEIKWTEMGMYHSFFLQFLIIP
jgi:hypothetical protein